MNEKRLSEYWVIHDQIRQYSDILTSCYLELSRREYFKKRLDECRKKEHEILKFIDSIDDSEIKYIVEMRFINNMSWHDIEATMSEAKGKQIDRTTIAKKMRKYLQENG